MRTYNVSLEQCLIHVIKARPCVLPNDGFLKQLILYDRYLVERRRQKENLVDDKPSTTVITTPSENLIPEKKESKSADPIYVIPIQVQSEESQPAKVYYKYFFYLLNIFL